MSKLPTTGVMPWSLKAAHFSGLEVSAMTLARPTNCLAARRPTSPHPMINTRSFRKREGKAPKGVWFEGKMGVVVLKTP
jgi:hypothetical protein